MMIRKIDIVMKMIAINASLLTSNCWVKLLVLFIASLFEYPVCKSDEVLENSACLTNFCTEML